jgi:L-fucose isomerase-like protein
MELSVNTVAFRNAPKEIIDQGRSKLRQLFPATSFRFVSEKPDVIFFLSGGSEQDAIKLLLPGKHYLLLADFGNNAYASANEVKAWADSKNISSTLVSLQEAEKNHTVEDFAKICQAYLRLNGKQAGLIGNVSHWLVASAFPLSLARERFGINITHLQWGKLPDYFDFSPDPAFLEVFKKHRTTALENEARVYAFLQTLIKEYKLDGLTLECFDMVNDRNVTACLALSLLNSSDIVAGCEGDLVSLVGMMLVQALTGNIPWMANIAGMYKQSILFAHCTAPLNLVSDFKLPTHFETDKSAAVEGNLQLDEVTVFRLNQNLNKAFISAGKVVSQPKHDFACRTQTEIELPVNDLEVLRHHPLGNHHLVIPGNQEQLLKWACRYKQIEVINE